MSQRLIDANALNEVLQERVGGPVSDELYEVNLCIIDAPTIDAIPVEFLERRREGLIFAAMTGSQVYGNKTIELCHAINMVLDMWQKEQEAK